MTTKEATKNRKRVKETIVWYQSEKEQKNNRDIQNRWSIEVEGSSSNVHM